MRIETAAIHTARNPDPLTGAVSPAIVMSTTFERDAEYELRNGYVYGRPDNPNRRALEELLATLEGGAASIALGSGQAAISVMAQSLMPGDHAIFPVDIYHGARALIQTHYLRWGLEASFIDMTGPGVVAAALRRNTRMVWVETPSNPRLRVVDIAEAAAAAHNAGAVCVVDNTWSTPFCQRPFAHGADIVMHSTTKYFGGHSDVIGGALVYKQTGGELYERARSLQTMGGAVPSPFDCWLLLRSIPSMACRMRAHIENAGRIAVFLETHPAVSIVHYPGLASHPQHAIAKKQMLAYGGMLSFEARGTGDDALGVALRTRLFKRATSLGGYESLIEHRASVEGANSVSPPTLLRCSIGLEHVDDLIEDLDQALRGA